MMEHNIFMCTLLLQITASLGLRIKGNGIESMEPKISGLSEGTYPVKLTRINNNYYGQITMGTAAEGQNEQILSVMFDTGSQHLWLASADACDNRDCFSVGGLTPFYGVKSITYEYSDAEFSLHYADGTVVTGCLARDTYKIGSEDKVLTIKNQIFGEALTLTGPFRDADGIFGLGLLSDQLLPGDPDPPFWSMVKQNAILPEFGMYLNRSHYEEKGGELVFGGHNDDLIEDEFTFFDVVTESGKYMGWRIQFGRISMNMPNVSRFDFDLSHLHAIPDSGCSLIIGPAHVMDQINGVLFMLANFDYKKSLFFRCTKDWSYFPNITIKIGAKEFVLTPNDYIRQLKGGRFCRSRMHGIPNSTHIVLGQPFMEKFYTKFDMLGQRIGFATAKHFIA